MRLAVYTRTSSAGDGTDSLAAQVQACAAYAVAHDHVIASTHADESVSGKAAIDQRPGLLAAVMAIETGAADGLIVHRIDRLARELHVQEAALARLWGLGAHVSVFEAAGGEILRDDPDDPYRTFLRLVLGAAAQLERGLVNARLQGGRKRKAAAGGYVGGSRLHSRYGYRLSSGAYEPIEAEQQVIASMLALRAEGASYRLIADEVQIAHGGGPWYPATVRRIIDRERQALASTTERTQP